MRRIRLREGLMCRGEAYDKHRAIVEFLIVDHFCGG